MVNFPAPIGGTVLPDDFAPSILFAILYAFIVPLMLYRMLNRRSRCLLLIGTSIFTVERVVVFSLRAIQARSEARRFSSGLVTYLQITFGLGFIGIASDAVRIARSLLVNATYGSDRCHESPFEAPMGGVPPPTADIPDQPQARASLRRITGLMGLAYLAGIIPGIFANSHYSKDFDSQSSANMTAKLRIASSAVVVALSCIVLCTILWGYLKLPRINRRGVAIIGAIYTLAIVVGIYRLSVMGIRTTSLSAPNVLNTPRAKATFYIFHVLPEWLASLSLFGNNIRETFGTGLVGDWRFKDKPEKEGDKRNARR